jgi:hypothetical protein
VIRISLFLLGLGCVLLTVVLGQRGCREQRLYRDLQRQVLGLLEHIPLAQLRDVGGQPIAVPAAQRRAAILLRIGAEGLDADSGTLVRSLPNSVDVLGFCVASQCPAKILDGSRLVPVVAYADATTQRIVGLSLRRWPLIVLNTRGVVTRRTLIPRSATERAAVLKQLTAP